MDRLSPSPLDSGHSKAHSFSSRVLAIGFIAGLTLAGSCLAAGAFYLYTFLNYSALALPRLFEASPRPDILDMAINAQLVIARLALLSCGVFVGMAFGFMGFALFLVGLQGEMDVSGQYESYNVKIARLSPGVFVILCSAILIGICATHKTSFDYTRGGTPDLGSGNPRSSAPLTPAEKPIP